MALVCENHETLAEDSRKFWEDTLKNARVNLFQLDKLIYQLTNDPKKSYGADTGQDSINVSKQDLPQLIDRRKQLTREIEELEIKLGIVDDSRVFSQAAPLW
jgi:hypothetical protein